MKNQDELSKEGKEWGTEVGKGERRGEKGRWRDQKGENSFSVFENSFEIMVMSDVRSDSVNSVRINWIVSLLLD